MMRRLYDWMMRMAGHKKAPQALFWVAFIESSVFPIPPDVMLIPMILAQRAKAFLYATICTVGSVIGGVAGYAIGYYLFELIGEPILMVYGYGEKYQQTADLFNEWGPWILIAKGWTPFPYKVLTIAAGAFKMSIVPFILASIVARAMRFYLVAALLYWFGEPIRDFIEKRLSFVTTAFLVLLVGGFVAIKYVF
jgi:membrane protein YqaA with SNARE-associated domain